jgi:hypothetical protein
MHPGTRLKQVEGPASPLQMSVREEGDYASTYFRFFNVTFENTSAEWLNVARVELEVPDPALAAQIRVPSGEQLQPWSEATAAQLAIKQHNEQVVLASIAVVAAISGAASKREAVKASGLTELAALGGLTISEINARLRELDNPNFANLAFPEGHLLHAFSVPPGLFLRRWIVLQIPRGARIPDLFVKVVDSAGRGSRFSAALIEPAG